MRCLNFISFRRPMAVPHDFASATVRHEKMLQKTAYQCGIAVGFAVASMLFVLFLLATNPGG